MKNTSASEGLSVLVVEDDFFLAQSLAEQLSDLGTHVVGPASTVSDALALAASTAELDGAILDLDLGRQFVYPVADLLASRGVAMVFATGLSRQMIDQIYWHIPHFKKPYKVAEILRALTTSRRQSHPD